MVPRPNLGGNSTFLCHGPLGQGVLFFVLTTTLTWGFKNVCGLVCVKVKWFGPGTFRIGPCINLGSDWAKSFEKLA